MSDNLNLGHLITTPQQRDAVHVAVAPVTAAECLSPGQPIGFIRDGDTEHVGTTGRPSGIVDPFLKDRVKTDERFWMFLYPGSITSLRHDWTHPAFNGAQAAAPAQQDKAESMKWMEQFADRHHSHSTDWYHGTGRDYNADEIIEYAHEFLKTGDRHVQQGSESLRDAMYEDDTAAEFWKHFGIITGIDVSAQVSIREGSTNPFCCTC